jgi:hypothetical protein
MKLVTPDKSSFSRAEALGNGHSRIGFLTRLGGFGAATALAGCGGAAVTGLAPASKAGMAQGRRRVRSVTFGSRTVTTQTQGNQVSFISTDINGNNPQVIATMTADGSTGLVTITSLNQPQWQIDANAYYNGSPTSLQGFGHTASPTNSTSSVGNSAVSGNVVTSGTLQYDQSASQATAVANGARSSAGTTPVSSGGGACGGHVCANAITFTTEPPVMHTVLSGIGFIAGFVALALFAPELSMAALVLATVGVWADFIDLLLNAFELASSN